jgi:EAL domain-containing protein (putative c-di-GMP-specific phosphodiesterase class I)
LHMSPQQLRNFEVFDSMGLALTIDGFGSTAQSHTLLRQWTLGGVKFDKRLMAQTADAHVLSARMQELARVALVRRIPIAAEGLSSVAQERAMKLMGCRLGQGSGTYQSLSAHTLDAIILQVSAEVTEMTRPWRGQTKALVSIN